MLVFGHVGIPIGLAYVLRRRWPNLASLDHRLLVLGAVLPDVLDKGFLGVSKGPGHMLLTALLLLAAGWAWGRWRAGGCAAGAWGPAGIGGGLATLGAGMLSHQLLDLPWAYSAAFLFPLLGDPALDPWRLDALHLLDQPVEALGEVVGLALLAWVGWRAGLLRGRGWRALLRRGHLADGRAPAPTAVAPGFLWPPHDRDVAYEFFAPFAHVPGRWEWCRVRSPTHGVFDLFIVLAPGGTHLPAVVYANSDAGERFMAERYPECATFRVPPEDLRIVEEEGGRVVEGTLRSGVGPVREAHIRIAAVPREGEDQGKGEEEGGRDGDGTGGAGLPAQRPYGGTGAPVWGSARWTCWGVDLELAAEAHGHVLDAEGRREELDRVPAVVTLGSFGRIAPRGSGEDAGVTRPSAP